MWSYWINIFDAVWQSSIIFFVAYFAYANCADVDGLSFGFSLVFSLTTTSLLHVVLQTTRVDILLILSILLSFLMFLGFTLVFDAECVACLTGEESPYQVSYRMFRQGIFWFTNLFTLITALLPRYLVKCIYNTTVNPLLRHHQQNNTSSLTPDTHF